MKHKILLLLVLSPLFLSGCVINFNTGSEKMDKGGVFVSQDKGNSWIQKVLIPTSSGQPKSIAGIDTNELAMDPGDNKALYLGSFENGLFYTYDRGDNWQISLSLGKITVKSIAVDPSDKCTIYASSGNKLFKSTDCSRTWAQTYFDNDLGVTVNAIAVDPYNSANVYIGLSRGEILKSFDRGTSWRTLNRFEDRVEKIVISASDSRIIFVGTRAKSIFRSTDAGANWASLSDNLKDFKDSSVFRDLVISKSTKGLIILANHYGLIRSADNGDSWSNIELITPEKEATINSVAINPKDANEIYYVTNTTFYHSIDGGKNWITKKLPTDRAGRKILVDPENPSIIYLGVMSIKN